MSIVALIPARGGSKRLPGKNKKLLGGKPLISWSIEAALDSKVFSHVVVSTDDEEIADIALKCGAEVPGLRPSSLATDTASSVSVALHAISEYEKKYSSTIDGLVLLQPTSPFRTVETIKRGVQLLRESDFERPVVSVKPAEIHPAWCFFETQDGRIEPVLGWESLSSRSQDLCPAWTLNGAFYGISPALLKKSHSFIDRDVIFLKMKEAKESIDIDTQDDWTLAETVF